MSLAYTLMHPATPLYTGGIAATEGAISAVGIAGREYPIDLRKYRHRGLPSFREGIVQSGEPSDQLFDSQGAWWRYRFSFHHGAGQTVADLERDDDPARYQNSRGIDPWRKYQACLLPDVDEKLAVSAAASHMIATATHIYISDGSGVKRTATLVGTPTWTSITGMAAETVVAMTTDGTDAYIATTNHIYVVGVGGVGATAVTSAVPTNDYNNVAFVSNRLLAGDGDLLVEVGSATLDTIFDHYQGSFRWSVIFSVGSRVYVGGYAGNRSEIFSTIVDDVGGLVRSAEAANFFAGELINTALSYGGIVLLGTSKGVRFATVGGDGALNYGPLIEAPGNVTTLAAEGRFAWCNWESFPDAGSGLGRIALDDFVDVLQPAYATDVFTNAVDDDVVAVARFEDRTIFVVSADAAYATEPGTYVTSGYLETGEIYFGTVENKSVGEVRATVNQLELGEGVLLELFDAETDGVLGSGATTTVDSVGVAVNAEGEVVNRLDIKITLSGDGTDTPCLRQWRARAYPIGPGVEEWIVPLIIQNVVTIGEGEGEHKSYDPYLEVERIKSFWESREVITYQEGNHAHRVRVDNFEFEPVDWTDDGDWLGGTLTVRLLSV